MYCTRHTVPRNPWSCAILPGSSLLTRRRPAAARSHQGAAVRRNVTDDGPAVRRAADRRRRDPLSLAVFPRLGPRAGGRALFDARRQDVLIGVFDGLESKSARSVRSGNSRAGGARRLQEAGSAGPGAPSHTALSAVSIFAPSTARRGGISSGRTTTDAVGTLKRVW